MKNRGLVSIVIILLVLVTAGVSVLLLSRMGDKEIPVNTIIPLPTIYLSTTPDTGTIYCGGLKGTRCPVTGYTCEPEGYYPDARTVCVSNGSVENSDACVVGGCSGEVCSEKGDSMVTTCLYKEEYKCYKTAICQRQETGKCGWTITLELKKCIGDTR